MNMITDHDFHQYNELYFYDVVLKYISKKEASYFYKRVMNESLFDILTDPESLYENISNLNVSEDYNVHFKTVIVQGGKQRNIYKAKPYGLLLTVIIASFLSKILEQEFSDSLYSFRAKRGRELALKDLSFKLKKNKQISFYKGDVSGYGDNIDQEILLSKVSKIVDPNSKLFKILKSFISISYYEDETLKVMKTGIPTGSPLTPVYENIYLMSLDDLMNVTKSIDYYRYGDDLLVVSNLDSSIAVTANQIKKHLEDIKLEIKPSKEFFQYSLNKTDSYSEWLGFAFNENLTLTTRKKYQDEFKADFKKRFNLHILNLKLLSSDEITALSTSIALYQSLVNPFVNQLAYKYLLFTQVDKYVKSTDSNLRSYTQKLLHRKLNIKKSSILNSFKNEKGLSLNYYRRILDKKRREGYFK